MTDHSDDLEQLITDIDKRESRELRVLTHLLDHYSQQKGKVFALRNEMGFTLEEAGQGVRIPSFLVTHTLDWVGKQVKMGSEMPFMQSQIDEKGRLIVDESVAESIKQRAPDWTRQPAIAAYLAHDKRRKFGTIVAVMNPPWVDDPKHENWGGDGRALKSAYSFSALDTKGQIGLLDLDETHIYALDGQHRVMGIRGIQDLQEKSHLQMKGRDGAAKKEVIGRDEFMTQFKLGITELQHLLNETIAIELIPAVIAGESMEKASQRIRSVFITINAYSQKTGKSETTLLDESDGFALVARKAGTLHPLFKGGKEGDGGRVNWKTSTLPQRTNWYTTLETLKSMAQRYLVQVNPSLDEAWGLRFKGQVPVRPEESEVEAERSKFFKFLDSVRKMPVFEGLEAGDDLDEIRLFPGFDKDNKSTGNGHLLTRPVGQEILASAVGALVREGHSLEKVFEKLNAWDTEGGFSQHLPENVWYGVTYDFAKDKMNTRTNIEKSADLLRYMVAGADGDKRTELLEFLVSSRSTGTSEKPAWRNFKGNDEPIDPESPTQGKKLPQPIDH